MLNVDGVAIRGRAREGPLSKDGIGSLSWVEGVPEHVLIPEVARGRKWEACYLPLVPPYSTASPVHHPEPCNNPTFIRN